MDDERVIFTKEMKDTHTILVPTMLPMHFRLICNIFKTYGYNMEILDYSGREVSDRGLRYVHNDTCYPALLVIGQFLIALQSGKYDPHKVALMLMQTGGGCRASNYISLLRKALKSAGFDYVPVISLNFAGLEDNPGFKLTIPMLEKMVYSVLFGDLLMLLRNQCRPYELTEGASEELAELWTRRLTESMRGKKVLRYRTIREQFRQIIRDFDSIPRSGEAKPRVGIVGEIFVKFSPLGNNNLEAFLLSEGAESVMPGLLDFCLYCVYNSMMDYRLYGMRPLKSKIWALAYRFLTSKQDDLIALIKSESGFEPMGSFKRTCTLTEGYIGLGAKMGEGWLLTAEMLELVDSGVKNIVCTQPFGCLPNHIVGKGMMKLIKEKHPEVNIVAVDYDPGATPINQENRIKLMLANARQGMEHEAAVK